MTADPPAAGRRWDVDERGHGVGSGEAFSPNVDELADAIPAPGGSTEEPEAHLLPHLRTSCDASGSRWTLTSWTVDEGILIVDVSWAGPGDTGMTRAPTRSPC